MSLQDHPEVEVDMLKAVGDAGPELMFAMQK